jgi:hypothetical protein
MKMRIEQWWNNTYKESEMQRKYKRNTEERSRNHCYPVERIGITYFECVLSVFLPYLSSIAKCMRHIIHSIS